ncbi:MAG TPA: FAD-dependent oxidoreductase [Allosphingosinicella sp.]|nr:FAD-dependent oxidoreductase [Allosphingosinicella sp.]
MPTKSTTTGITRRTLLLAGAGAAATAALPRSLKAQNVRAHIDVLVIGAGVFGAWTAMKLREAGKSVMLVDAWSPAHARASSGGESRMTRSAYGADEVYTRMAADSLGEWRALSSRAGLPIFHETGVLFFFPDRQPYLEDSLRVHRQLGVPIDLLSGAALRRAAPAIAFNDGDIGLYEPRFGALMARRAVQTLVAEFDRAGGMYRQAAVRAPGSGRAALREVVTTSGETIAADSFVFACGPWLGRLFPALLGRRIFPTRQEVFFFAPEAGDESCAPGNLPGWADFNGGDIYYGFPDLEGRGFKIAHDAHGPPMDPDTGDRVFTPSMLADVRAFMARRFPRLADRPLSESRVCQYENSSNGDFLIDRHPEWQNVFLVGGGSGHGFKHGPAVGRYAAELALGRLTAPEPRFSLATKAEVEARAVH